ncbi:hypothetical protein A2870_02250 [Candidatus Curtissbacteria bacterium RIFCSPHIGHO2_01_FULL_41_11]|uniref:Protein-L-isoaspartate O-methyltransferase n=1 Tax=Candidatus Curtissbacteria bacterium RIFCSPHIGHO2_01_FULL_41_11 TaxID=1797711 RepID=A0A1F5G648_9BACT|nr:MAG: hypothetical protein A2870_02250 [Candidatus Curtissbacteria bacterium RIFCSPHIGHO2_01_FULL_41_11]
MAERSEELSSLRETFVDRVIIPRFTDYRASGQIIEDTLVFEAFRSVDRGLFVPPDTNDYSIYTDSIVLLREGSTISEPGLVSLMMHGLQLTGDGKVLEIGTASGYGAALLSHCAEEVHTIEIDPELGQQAKERLDRLGYSDVVVHIGDGLKGIPAHAPFDSIIVTAGLRKIPKPLIDQLSEGGIIIAPVGANNPHDQDIIQGLKRGKRLQSRVLIEKVSFVCALSPEKGGWTRRSFDMALKRKPERKNSNGKPILEQVTGEISPEELAKTELFLSKMKSLDPISHLIEERIGVLMDQGLNHGQIIEDPELMRLKAEASQISDKISK